MITSMSRATCERTSLLIAAVTFATTPDFPTIAARPGFSRASGRSSLGLAVGAGFAEDAPRQADLAGLHRDLTQRDACTQQGNPDTQQNPPAKVNARLDVSTPV